MINEIITAMEKECAVAEFQFDKANMLFEMVEKNHDMMYQEASVMVYANDRSYDDLCALYEAADAETAQKKGGIISSLVDAVAGIFKAIGDMFGKLINAITGNSQSIPETANITKEDAEILDSLDEFSNKSGSVISKFTNIKVIGGAAAAALTLLGGTKLFSLLKDKKNNATGETNKPTTTRSGDEIANKIKIIPTLTKNIGNLVGKIKSIFSKDKTEGSDEGGEDKTNGLLQLLMNVGKNLKSFGNKMAGIFKLPLKGNVNNNGTGSGQAGSGDADDTSSTQTSNNNGENK